MFLTYDPKYNIAYLRFKEKPEQVETIEVSPELNVDLAGDGTVYGIELLNANEQLAGDSLKEFVVVNESTGERVAVNLAV